MESNSKQLAALRIYASAENIKKIKGFINLLCSVTYDEIVTSDRNMTEVASKLRYLVSQYCSPIGVAK